jgi:transposase
VARTVARSGFEAIRKVRGHIDRNWDGIAAHRQPTHDIPPGFVEGINNKIRVIQRRAYGLRDDEYLKLKMLTFGLPEL